MAKETMTDIPTDITRLLGALNGRDDLFISLCECHFQNEVFADADYERMDALNQNLTKLAERALFLADNMECAGLDRYEFAFQIVNQMIDFIMYN